MHVNAGHNIIMFINNFSGHFIKYKPWNICLEYFEPNLTSFVQPCNAGIIHCVKAHYCHAYCFQAIELDEADEHDIYKIDLLKAMLMARDAWDAVTAETIKHCWHHTGIQPPIPTAESVTTTMMATPPPTTIQQKQKRIGCNLRICHLVIHDTPTSWGKAQIHFQGRLHWPGLVSCINNVLEAENDELKVMEAIEKLTKANNPFPAMNSTNPATPSPLLPPPQLQDVTAVCKKVGGLWSGWLWKQTK